MTTWPAGTIWKYSVRELQRRPGRATLTLLGIVLGVAAVVSINITTQTTHGAYRAMYASLAGRAALEVVAEGLGGFDEQVAEQLEGVSGVQAAVPLVQYPTAAFDSAGAVPLLALGVETTGPGRAREEMARSYVLLEGKPLDSGDGVLLPAPFAAAHGFAVGGKLRLLTPLPGTSGPQIVSLPILGLLKPEGTATFNGGAVVFLPRATAQRCFGLTGQINCVQFVLADSASVGQVEAEIRQRLPTGLLVQVPAARSELAEETLRSTEVGLSSLSLVSFVGGAFVILNSFAMNLGERRKQLAILRALGATRSQVIWILIREALIFGAVGTTLGVALGLALAVALRRILGDMMMHALPSWHWSWQPFLLALLLGPGMTLAALAAPAWRAARRAPLQDLLSKARAAEDVPRRWPSWLGLSVVVASLAFALAIALDRVQGFDPTWLGPLTAVTMVGAVLAFPLWLRRLSGAVAFVLKPVLGLEARLAARHLERYPTRTALTAGVLFVGMAMSIGFGQSLRNNTRNIYEWATRNISEDFLIRGLMPDSTLVLTSTALPEALGSQLEQVEGVAHVGMLSFLLGRAGGRQVILLPRTLAADGRLPFALAAGAADKVLAGWPAGEVVLGTPLARKLGVRPGDSVSVATRQGARRLTVAGTTSDYTVGGMVIYLDWYRGKEWFAMEGVHVFLITARTGSAEDLLPRLQAFAADRRLYCQPNAEFRRAVERAVEGVSDFFWMLVVLVFVVASLGTVNTLTMNVLEQTREIGVLRAIAMPRRQVRRLILAQAVILGMLGLIPGTLLGMFTAWIMNESGRVILGQPIAFHLDASLIGGCFLAGVAITLLAAWIPARRAASVAIIRALQYE